MKIEKLPSKIVILLLVFFLNVGGNTWAASASIENRADNIFKLLHESSGARQVIDGSSEAARDKRREAVELYERALEVKNDNEAAGRLLNESAKRMFEAIKIATPSVLSEEKLHLDFDRRQESVFALREAFNRISDENNESQSKREVNRELDRLLSEANGFDKKGQGEKARIALDKAYHLLKVSIDAMRSGQTLVRSLQFESEKDEYLYEIDRNDTHRMLVDLLIDQQNQSTWSQGNVSKKVEESAVLRKQAESYAEAGAYQQAIEILEQSTRSLVAAIRSAGIYIPG